MKRPPKPTPTNKGAYAVVKDRGKRASMMLVGQVMDNGDGSLMIISMHCRPVGRF